MDKNKIIAKVMKILAKQKLDLTVRHRNPEGEMVSYSDAFESGHCHEFAIALHRVFGYRFGVIKGYGFEKDTGKKRKYLYHAFGVTSKNKYFDINGQLDIQPLLKAYEKQVHPETGTIAEKVSVNIYNDEKTFRSKLWTIPVKDSYIQQGIKRISSHPHKYFIPINLDREEISIKEIQPLKFDDLVTNEKYEVFGNSFHRLLPGLNIKLLRLIKKKLYINKWWKVEGVHLSGNGLEIEVGLGTSDLFSPNVIIYKNKIDSKLSDEESKNNIDEWILKLADFASSDKVRGFFIKSLNL